MFRVRPMTAERARKMIIDNKELNDLKKEKELRRWIDMIDAKIERRARDGFNWTMVDTDYRPLADIEKHFQTLGFETVLDTGTVTIYWKDR